MIFANSLLKKPKILAFKYWKTELLEELETMMFGKIRKGRLPKDAETEDQEEETNDEENNDDEENTGAENNDDDDDGEEENDNNGEEETDDDGEEENAGAQNDDEDDAENVDDREEPKNDDDQPSTKIKWTRPLVREKRGTPEKQGLQMIIGIILLNVHQMYFGIISY